MSKNKPDTPGGGAKIIPLSPGGRPAGKGPRCPTCGQATVAAHRPFCSKRCADRDLGRWLNEDYRVPAEEPAALPDSYPGDDEEG